MFVLHILNTCPTRRHIFRSSSIPMARLLGARVLILVGERVALLVSAMFLVKFSCTLLASGALTIIAQAPEIRCPGVRTLRVKLLLLASRIKLASAPLSWLVGNSLCWGQVLLTRLIMAALCPLAEVSIMFLGPPSTRQMNRRQVSGVLLIVMSLFLSSRALFPPYIVLPIAICFSSSRAPVLSWAYRVALVRHPLSCTGLFPLATVKSCFV